VAEGNRYLSQNQNEAIARSNFRVII
jgi:hypothetical protein